MTDDAVKTLVHAFIGSQLDYTAMDCGIIEGLLSRLQSLQNAAASLVTGQGRREHISPMLRQLDWLPVRQCVQFRLAKLVYRLLAETAPAYLSDDCLLSS